MSTNAFDATETMLKELLEPLYATVKTDNTEARYLATIAAFHTTAMDHVRATFAPNKAPTNVDLIGLGSLQQLVNILLDAIGPVRMAYPSAPWSEIHPIVLRRVVEGGANLLGSLRDARRKAEGSQQ